MTEPKRITNPEMRQALINLSGKMDRLLAEVHENRRKMTELEKSFQSMWVNTEVQNSKMQALLRENLRPDSKKTLPSSSKQLQARPPPGSASRPLVVDSRTGWSQFADFMDKQSDDN